MRLSALIWVITYFFIDRLPPSTAIRSELYTAPIQETIPSTSFTLNYKGLDTKVKTVANYALWGVVVSQSNNSGFIDLMHDEYSIDSKDFCVVWGGSLKDNIYHDITYGHGDWSCSYRYKQATRFNPHELSNTHLITDNEKIRTIIGKVRIGDQIFIRGQLVNYSENRWNDSFWRNTSTVRTDGGNGACEVMFVEELRILDSYNWLPNLVQKIASYLFITTLFLRLALLCCFPRESNRLDINIP